MSTAKPITKRYFTWTFDCHFLVAV